MIVKLGNVLLFTLNIFNNTTYPFCQVKIPKLYKHVTAGSVRWHDDGSS